MITAWNDIGKLFASVAIDVFAGAITGGAIAEICCASIFASYRGNFWCRRLCIGDAAAIDASFVIAAWHDFSEFPASIVVGI